MTPGTVPPTQLAAAITFGRLVAQGIIEAEDAVRGLCEAAIRAGYGGDRRGLQAQLAWRVRDAAEECRIARVLATDAIRKAIQPHLDARAAARAIQDIASQTNDNRHAPLLPREVRAIVEQEMLARIQRTPARKRAYGR